MIRRVLSHPATVMSALVATAVLVALSSGQSCQTPGGVGICLDGLCPTSDTTCLTNLNVCCNVNQIIPASTASTPTTLGSSVSTASTVSSAATTAAANCVDLLNPATGVSDCPSRAFLCNNPTYRSLMMVQCPRTCGFCTSSSTNSSSTCVDLLNPVTGVSDCPARANLCTDPNYQALMTVQCPLTCGRCSSSSGSTSTNSTSCVDLLNPATGVSDCPSRAGLCNVAAYFTLMTQQCPRTCGRCGSSSGSSATNSTSTSTTACADLLNPATGVSDCPSRAFLCNNAAYLTLMTQQCPLTCGRCTSNSTISTTSTNTSTNSTTGCADLLNPSTGVSDCPSVSNLCTNVNYATLMAQQCPLTCGLCTGK